MHIKDRIAKEMAKATDSYIDICDRAIKEDPKHPQVNAELFGPFLDKLKLIFSDEQ